MPRKSRFPMVWWFVIVDKEYFNLLTCEESNSYLVKSHTKSGAAKFIEKDKACKVLDIRPATDSEYLDAVRVIP